jgi:hypothetical protein
LALFERYARLGLIAKGRSADDWARLEVDKAIDLLRSVTGDVAERYALEAVYMWEIRDPRALEWAKTAQEKGAIRMGELLAEIQKGPQ